jgi:hypothetical protein
LVAQGPLGQLVTRGIIDRYLKDPRSAADERSHALDWLGQLEQTGTS